MDQPGQILANAQQGDDLNNTAAAISDEWSQAEDNLAARSKVSSAS
jgi:hypothetical protein